MDKQGKSDLFDKYLDRYLTADKKEKGEIIDEIEYLTNMHRKSIIRRFRNEQMTTTSEKEKENRGRKVKYGPDVNYALKEVWQLASKICGERLSGNIRIYVKQLKRFNEWKHKPKTTELLLEMSEATIKRRISDFRVKTKNKKDYNEDKPKGITEVIPVRQERNYEPGSGELDTIAHSNNTKEETNVWTLNYIDIELHWVLLAAQLGRGERRTVSNMDKFNEWLPFPFKQAKHLNQLYQKYLIDYLNFFQPTMKCIGKEKDKHHNDRIYDDQAKTPYQRVQEHSQIDQKVKNKLKEKKQQLNPRKLKENIDKMIRKIKKLAEK